MEAVVKNKQGKMMAIRNEIKLVSGLFLTYFIHFGAFAQTVDGLSVNATVQSEYDDNVLRSNTSVSDSSFKVSPELKFVSLYGKHQFNFGYQGAYAAYYKNTDLNFDEHNINISALLDHSYRFNSEFRLSYQDKIEEPGITNSVSTLAVDEFTQYNDKSAMAKFYYGGQQSTGQVVVAVNIKNRDFSNNQQEFRNVDSNKLTGTFFYRLGPKTRLLLESSFTAFDYNSSELFSDQSNDENEYFTGVEWKATAQTDGSFKIGYQTKKYDAEQFNTVSGLSYFLNANWRPLTHTKFSFDTKRETTESAQLGVGGFLSTSYSLSATHELTSRSALLGQYFQSKDDITSTLDRTDHRKSIQFGFTYAVNSWLMAKLDYRYLSRESDVELFDYDANVVALSLTSTLR